VRRLSRFERIMHLVLLRTRGNAVTVNTPETHPARGSFYSWAKSSTRRAENSEVVVTFTRHSLACLQPSSSGAQRTPIRQRFEPPPQERGVGRGLTVPQVLSRGNVRSPPMAASGRLSARSTLPASAVRACLPAPSSACRKCQLAVFCAPASWSAVQRAYIG
jgi:hypothetical protein